MDRPPQTTSLFVLENPKRELIVSVLLAGPHKNTDFQFSIILLVLTKTAPSQRKKFPSQNFSKTSNFPRERKYTVIIAF